MPFSKDMNRRLILIVDDQEINRNLLGTILGEKYDVIYAVDGLDALEKIRSNQDQLSIVLLDLLMPRMDGFEVLQAIKQDPSLSSIPVMVLTSEKSAEVKALDMGAADFITKPFDMPDVILARVSRMIELLEGRSLIHNAGNDPLTGLYTGVFFYDYVDQIIKHHPDWKMDAVALNIDRFHSINELYGREYGNNVLTVLGREIRSFLSENGGIGCRTQADQFLISCMSRSSYESVFKMFQSRLDRFSKGAGIHLRMGVCPWREDLTIEQQFDRAKLACNMGRGNYMTSLVVYDEKMYQDDLYSERLISDVNRAAAEHQFLVFYQPKYDIQSVPPRLKSAEALIRWNHPELGMISPGVFIPLFEGNGLISIVDNYVWEETARQIQAWKQKYGWSVPVSVNLSRADLFDPSLEQKLLSLLKQYEITTEDLLLEVTESAYTDNAEHLIEVVRKLRSDGFRIEMDDFGSGYSSLNMLSSLPIDALKMDMKFIQNAAADNREFRLIELILDIAEFLGVPVIAEGVETENQMTMLKDAGCDLVQGYYFSKPVPAPEFEKLIENEITLRKERAK